VLKTKLFLSVNCEKSEKYRKVSEIRVYKRKSKRYNFNVALDGDADIL